MNIQLKKIIAAVIAVVLLGTTAGCSNKQRPADTLHPASDATSSEQPAKESNPSQEAQEAQEAMQNGEAGFSIPKMTEEQQQYNKQYVSPLCYSELLLRSWSPEDISMLASNPDKSQIGAYIMFAFEDIMGQEKMQALRKKYPEGNIPAEAVDEVLLAHFSFSPDQLHEMNAFYRPEQNSYDYQGGRGGGPVESVVTAVIKQDDGTVLLNYSFFSDFASETSARYRVRGMLTLVPDENGGYRYWSVAARAPEQSDSAAQTAVFALGVQGNEEKNLGVGDTIGGWTLSDLQIDYDTADKITMLEANFTGKVTLKGKISRSALLEMGYDFIVAEEDADKIPLYIPAEGTKKDSSMFMLNIPDGTANAPTLEHGEELACKITISSYHSIFAYMTAPSGATVASIETSA